MVVQVLESSEVIMPHYQTPELMPTLSRGKHRTPRRGACFMEFASYLAGERWSDHPACTDPGLAALARGVNDAVGDTARSTLPPLIPRVIGLRTDDSVLTVRVALRAAIDALPIASMERQRALAVAGLSLLELLVAWDAHDPVLDAGLADALAQAPEAARWASRFHRWIGADRHLKQNVDQMAQVTIRLAVLGIAEACAPETDGKLTALLEHAIVDGERQVAAQQALQSRPSPREYATA